MKTKFLAICALLLLAQCTIDEDEATLIDSQNLTADLGTTIPVMTPNPSLDNNHKGLYQGTVATHNMSFHEKITINLGNDDNYNAFIQGQDGRLYTFKGTFYERRNVAIFKGYLGHFSVSLDHTDSFALSNTPTVTVFDAVFNGAAASMTAFKDRSNQRVLTSLGTFASDGVLPGDDGTTTGTWDFTFVSSGPGSLGFTIPTLTLVRDGGSTFVLDTNGDYQRLCSAPGTPVPIGVVNSSFFNIQSSNSSIELAGATLNYTIVGNRLEGTNAGCRDFPSANLDINIANWSWNGIQGTATLNTSSLPDFSGI